MSIRPIDMQTSIGAITNTNQQHQHNNQMNVNAHSNISTIQKEQTDNKQKVQDPKNSRKVDALKEDEDENKQKRKQQEEKQKEKQKADNEEKQKDTSKDEEDTDKKKKVFTYKRGEDGKLEIEETDLENEEEVKPGHIDFKA